MADVDELRAQLRAGRSLAPSRGRMVGLCGVLGVLGVLLAALGGDDPVLLGLAGLVVAFAAASLVLFATGWTGRRAVWLAREGVVFERPAFRYHVPWDEIADMTVAGRSLLARVQVTLRDVEAVVATVARKRRGGKLRAQARLRRLLNLNKRVGEKCHFEFLTAGAGVDAAALRAVLVGYVEEPERRAELRPLPVFEDSPGSAGP